MPKQARYWVTCTVAPIAGQPPIGVISSPATYLAISRTSAALTTPVQSTSPQICDEKPATSTLSPIWGQGCVCEIGERVTTFSSPASESDASTAPVATKIAPDACCRSL